jgi:hypothetical protein
VARRLQYERDMKTTTMRNGSVRHTDSTYEVCPRCGGSGACTHEVAPWVRPVGPTATGLAPAEVTVLCDRCSGSGLVRVGA